MSNRVIKFRAWFDNGKDQEMLQVGDDFGTTGPLDCCHYAIQGQPVSLMQFTGLYDKNGVEIYEGDIVCRRWEDTGGIIEATVDVVTMERFPVYWLENEEFGYEGEYLASPDMYEVIGNIHENKELLS